MSKSTPKSASVKFQLKGKKEGKKDFGSIAMQYGHVYVANCAMG